METRFLENLGRRVREARKRQGLTGQQAADAAGLSRRFYGQLENGLANIAVGRLAKVAEVLGVSLARLLAEADGESLRSQRIGLLGLRGAGKSTLGALLAARLALPFVELDARIEAEAGLSVSTLFEVHGEAVYRDYEARCLSQWTDAGELGVVALSGGVVLNPRAMKILFRGFTTIWLKASPEDHMARVLAQGDTRPVSNRENAMEELRALLTARAPLYAAADLQVETSGIDAQDAVERLFSALMDTTALTGAI